MKKSNFCSDHFALNCRLCGDGEPEVFQNTPTEMQATVAQAIAQKITSLEPAPPGSIPAVAIIPTLIGASEQIPPVPPKSEEAQAVLSVTDEYAKSCDDLKRANDAVNAMHQHIDKMESMLKELLADVVLKKKNKDELKRKVLETLAMGSD